MYHLLILWNREFTFSEYSTGDSIDNLIKQGNSLLNSGDGAEAKDFKIVNDDGDQVYPSVINTKELNKVQPKDTKDIKDSYINQELYLYKGWIDAPSKIQPYHDLHGKNVIIAKIGDKCKVVLTDELDSMSQFYIDPKYLVITSNF